MGGMLWMSNGLAGRLVRAAAEKLMSKTETKDGAFVRRCGNALDCV